ncbi:MAG: hypothetical protein Hens3KO_20960 [Henriciella sp.]
MILSHDQVNANIGKRIQVLRVSNNLTLDDLAHQLGCSPRLMKNMEAGVTVISAAMVCQISQILSVSPDDILTQKNASNVTYLHSVA